MTDQILSSIDDGVMTIRINRPEKKNALTVAMYAAMHEALQGADADDSVRVILITGTADVFSAGNDILDFIQNPPFDEDSPVGLFLQGIVRARKPVVAAVNGVAIGIGTTMLLHCDLVYAGEGARFRLPFVNLALTPEAGSSYLLPRMVGHQRAAELLMLGETFDAATAREIGFVNEVLPDEEVETKALAIAHELAAKPPAALRLTKALLKRGSAQALEETIRYELDQFRDLLQSPEAMEAFTAFMERRKPDFSKFS